MRKARFTEHQIITVLKSVEAGRTVKDVCREAGISEASYYNWKAKFGGMEASDIKKMKDLEDENRRLKQMFADLSLECRALKDVIEKSLKPAIKRELVNYLAAHYAMSIRHACRTLSLSRTVFRYLPDTRRNEPVIVALTAAAERYPRYGFKKLFQVLRRQGNAWNHKRVHRIYCLLKLNFRRKGNSVCRYITRLHWQRLRRLIRAGPSILCTTHWSAGGAFGLLTWWMILIGKRWQ